MSFFELSRSDKARAWARRAAFACAGALVFAACSNNDAATPLAAAGPADVQVAWGLECGGLLPVQLTLTNWTMRPPDTCYGFPQCGSARVTVTFGNGTAPFVTATSASSFIIDLRAFDDATLQSISSLSVEMLDDAGNPFPLPDGGLSIARQPTLPCADAGDAGAAAAAGAAGAAGMSGAAQGGTGGTGIGGSNAGGSTSGGASGAAGASDGGGGAGGTGAGGTSGTSGTGGLAGAAGA
ncbi:MAG TPA: hypothetical protein VGM29_00900 [Polyangiaceae bacterium]|jgi:hypothetical protein